MTLNFNTSGGVVIQFRVEQDSMVIAFVSDALQLSQGASVVTVLGYISSDQNFQPLGSGDDVVDDKILLMCDRPGNQKLRKDQILFFIPGFQGYQCVCQLQLEEIQPLS